MAPLVRNQELLSESEQRHNTCDTIYACFPLRAGFVGEWLIGYKPWGLRMNQRTSSPR
jgi:hypothetical protein